MLHTATSTATYPSSIGTYGTLRGSTYSARGRINVLSAYCSRICAVQPLMRLIARRSFVIHKDTEATRPGALVKQHGHRRYQVEDKNDRRYIQANHRKTNQLARSHETGQVARRCRRVDQEISQGRASGAVQLLDFGAWFCVTLCN